MPLLMKQSSNENCSSTSDSEKEEEDSLNKSKIYTVKELRIFKNQREDVIHYSLNGKRPLFNFRVDALTSNLNEHKIVAEQHRLAYQHSKGNCLLLQALMSCHGVKQNFTLDGKIPTDFNFLWSGCHLKIPWFSTLKSCQKVNHFPKSTELTRKDRLFQNIEHMQNIKGFEHFNIVPRTFILPREYHKFYLTARKEKCLWIVKPPASSRGRGIYIIDHPDKVGSDENAVVSQYICNPLLINSFKFDVRLYVAVTSFDPLVVYLYEDGLTRFATVPFDNSPSSIFNECMHLTNYSINKKSSQFIRNTDAMEDDTGSKWSLKALLRHLQYQGINTNTLMASIEDLIIKSLISVEWIIASSFKAWVPHSGNCFELYGFDVLIDDKLKPWLLEVNLTPSLACDSPLDLNIKANVITDLLNLVGIECRDPLSARSEKSKIQYKKKFLTKAQMWWKRRLINKQKHISTYMMRRRSIHMALHKSLSHEDFIDVEDKRDMQEHKENSWVVELNGMERKMVDRVRNEWKRRAGFVRIFPAPEAWTNYRSLFVSTKNNNNLLHNQLFFARNSRICETHLVNRCFQYHRKLPTTLQYNAFEDGTLDYHHPFTKMLRESTNYNSKDFKSNEEERRRREDGKGDGLKVDVAKYFKHLISSSLACLNVTQLKAICQEYLRKTKRMTGDDKNSTGKNNFDEVVDMIGECDIGNKSGNLHAQELSKGIFSQEELDMLLNEASTKDLYDIIVLSNGKDVPTNENLNSSNGHSVSNHRLDRSKSCKPSIRTKPKNNLINLHDSKIRSRPITSTLTRTIKAEKNNNTYQSQKQMNSNHENDIHQPSTSPLPNIKKQPNHRSFLVANERMHAKEKLCSATKNKKLPISSSSLTQALSIYGTQHRTSSAKHQTSPIRLPSPTHFPSFTNSENHNNPSQKVSLFFASDHEVCQKSENNSLSRVSSAYFSLPKSVTNKRGKGSERRRNNTVELDGFDYKGFKRDGSRKDESSYEISRDYNYDDDSFDSDSDGDIVDNGRRKNSKEYRTRKNSLKKNKGGSHTNEKLNSSFSLKSGHKIEMMRKCGYNVVGRSLKNNKSENKPQNKLEDCEFNSSHSFYKNNISHKNNLSLKLRLAHASKQYF